MVVENDINLRSLQLLKVEYQKLKFNKNDTDAHTSTERIRNMKSA